jgi:hypothetical protein
LRHRFSDLGNRRRLPRLHDRVEHVLRLRYWLASY